MLTDDQLRKARDCALRIAQRYRLADPQDAAQDAVVALWQAAERQMPERFEPWMYTVVRRRILDNIRSQQPNGVVFDELHHTGECDLANFDQRSRAESTVAQITDPLTRQLADLVLDGHTIRAAAEECRITETAARKRLRRGRM